VIDRNLEAANPDSPWMWRKDWIEGRIRAQTGPTTLLAWVTALLWNGFTWPLLAALWGDPGRRAMVKVILLFCLCGIVLLLWAITNTLRWLRFGTPVFEMASNPGVIGGTLEGQVHTRVAARPEKPLQATLTCVRRVVTHTRRRGGTTVNTELLWQGGRRIAPQELVVGPRGLSIPIRIQIPSDLRSTDISEPADQIIWTLGVLGVLPGVDLDAQFTVPVFVTEDSRPGVTQEMVDDDAEQEDALVRPAARGASFETPVVVRWTPRGGVEYTFRLEVSLKVAIQVTLVAVVVSTGSVLLWIWLGEAGPFALVPGFLGALLLLASAVIWTFSSRVLIEDGTIRVRKSVLGIPRRRQVPFADVKAVTAERQTVEGANEGNRDWEVKIERYSGEPVDIGASFARRGDAKRIAEEIEKLIF